MDALFYIQLWSFNIYYAKITWAPLGSVVDTNFSKSLIVAFNNQGGHILSGHRKTIFLDGKSWRRILPQSDCWDVNRHPDAIWRQ